LIGDSTLALLESVNAELGARLWQLVSGGAGVDDLLEEFSATGLRSLGAFAMVQVEESSIRLVVRGAAVVALTTTEGRQEFSGRDVRTWHEVVVSADSPEVELRLDADVGAESPFRVTSGLVPAVALRRGPEKPLANLSPSAVDSVDFPDVGSLLVHADEGTATPVTAPANAAVIDLAETRTVEQFLESMDVETDPPDQSGRPGVELEASPVAQSSDERSTDYYSMWGHTVARTVQGAAVQLSADGSVQPVDSPRSTDDVVTGGLIQAVPGLADATGAQTAAGQLGDHDGRTMTKAQLQALRAGPAQAVPSQSMAGPSVQALMCPAGHPSPPGRSSCRSCGAALGETVVVITRPTLGTLRFSDQTVVSLDRPALVGRNPKVDGSLLGELPSIIKLDVGQGLSRTHASIRIEGWQVLIEDLNSQNGTVVQLPGREARRLHAREPLPLENGSTIDFGGEISCSVELL